jgi:hypothetical protein
MHIKADVGLPSIIFHSYDQFRYERFDLWVALRRERRTTAFDVILRADTRAAAADVETTAIAGRSGRSANLVRQ